MNDKDIDNILHDLNKIFDGLQYKLVNNTNKYIVIHLKIGQDITALDFPHLLTILNYYKNINLNIFVANLNQLAIKLWWLDE